MIDHPGILLALALLAWAYGRGLRALWRRAGTGRGVERWRAWAFGGGLLALGAALVSPIDALAVELLSAHMLQHQLLVLGAAPLLVLGATPTALLWALPEPSRRRLGCWSRSGMVRAGWRALGHPLTVWLMHAGALWGWHLPALYQGALANPLLHAAEHASFLGTAVLFWWAVLGPGHGRLNAALGALYLFAASLAGGLLGALMTFAPAPWYPAYAATTPARGLDPLQDQQLAGLIMWIPAGLVYLAATLARIWTLLSADDAPAESRVSLPG